MEGISGNFRQIFFTVEQLFADTATPWDVHGAFCLYSSYLFVGMPQRGKEASPPPVGTFLASPPCRVIR